MNSRTNSDMMNLQINPVNFSASDRLTEYLQKKTEKLTTYFDRIVDVEVFLKLDTHQSVKDKTAEIKVNIPGNTLFASETSKTFEESADMAFESLRRQLLKAKEKMRK